MLNDEDKARIVAEESLRKEIRDALSKDGEKKETRYWKYVNSQLGVLLITSILITPAGALFTQLQQEVTSRRKTAEILKTIDFEIGYRLSQVLFQLYQLTDQKSPRATPLKTTSPDDVRRVLEAITEPEPKSVRPLFLEPQKKSLEQLIAERKMNTNDSKLEQELDSRLSAILGRRMLEGDLLNVNAKAGYIIADLMLPEWKKGSFYFTDCIRESPFC